MLHTEISILDKYTKTEGPVHITGTQALVRLAIVQSLRDKAAGLNTACYISGYRGSPMHNIDKELWRMPNVLDEHSIKFNPGINEDLAATALWGTQNANAMRGALYDGVYSMWYGKGPGIDRSMDAIRHAHMNGTSRHGGVLAVVGDDHSLSSTDVPAAHENAFAELMMPVLYPASVAEIIELGLLGWAMSRFAGFWVGFKVIPDTVDATSIIDAEPFLPVIAEPDGVLFPPEGVNIRVPDLWYEQEPRLKTYKLPAALAFARANRINRVMLESSRPRFGIIASGKAYNDARQALYDLGIDDEIAAGLGITILKIAMPYPFDAETVRAFADGLEEVLVVEEKLDFTETHVRAALYGLPDGRRPRVVGQQSEDGGGLPAVLPELTPEIVAKTIAGRIAPFHTSEAMRARLLQVEDKEKATRQRQMLEVKRTPYFCSGCPHNTSTKVPEGSYALGGVGCHFMATQMERDNFAATHMGAEGANWIGHAPYTSDNHVFQNMGDGTYYHSGLLAIRASVAAESTITYKILFNSAVAMTGGQPIDGPLTPEAISWQVQAEGVKRIHVVSEDPDQLAGPSSFAPGTKFSHRSDLDQVQRDCRDFDGVSVLIYEQMCAAERRRQRRRGRIEDPDRRVFINSLACEGCGDCNTQSNCVSVTPLDTPLGRKRRIDQSSCNKDMSCAEGFCPSFVSVHGAELKAAGVKESTGQTALLLPADLVDLPEPTACALPDGRPYNILVAGVGGTGVVTIGALITMAAHIEGNCFSAVDQFGMAQKGGAVTSHLRLAANAEDIRAVRLNAATADLVIGCDSLVTGADLALNTMAHGSSRVLVNTNEQITGQFARNPDLIFPSTDLKVRIEAAAGADQVDFVAATRLARALMGDAIASNLFIVGYAYQKGLLPVSAEAIEKAIELNGVAVAMNSESFTWGRRAAVDAQAIEALAARAASAAIDESTGADESLDEAIARRAEDLRHYQNAAYAKRYSDLVERVRAAEAAVRSDMADLTDAVARGAYKLMAYKDEYEVARLYTDGRFEAALRQQFDGDFTLAYHMAPPTLSRGNEPSGRPAKRRFGPNMIWALKVLTKFKALRGSMLDPFGHTAERKTERQLITDYERLVVELTDGLTADTHALAVQLARLPEKIRGYGPIKDGNIESTKAEEAALLEQWRAGGGLQAVAE